MNKEPRLRFTDEERSEPALEKPIRKAEKAADRADKAQANIPKKKVRQTVIDPDTGKKTSKLTFEDKKKPPSKVSQGVRQAPVHLVAGKLHKEPHRRPSAPPHRHPPSRRSHARTGSSPPPSRIAAVRHRPTGGRPVSYTHLDVYKRQLEIQVRSIAPESPWMP